MIRVVHPGSGSWFLLIRDPGVKNAPDLGFRFRIRITDHEAAKNNLSLAITPLGTGYTQVNSKLCLEVTARGSQRDVVYIGWLIAPSYMSPIAGGYGGLRGLRLSQWVQLCTCSQESSLFQKIELDDQKRCRKSVELKNKFVSLGLKFPYEDR